MIVVLIIITLAFLLRVAFIPQGAISFHYDMARDAFEARQIWKMGDLKIIGPPTTTPGLYSGALYYYLIAIPYGLSAGDPRFAAIFLSFLNSFAILPIFLLSKDIFKSTAWAMLASIFYAVSFEAIQYGPWLSNPSPAILTVTMFFYSLRLWQIGNKWGLALSILFASISAQFELFLIFLLVVVLIFKFTFNLRVNIKQFLLSITIASLTLSTFFVAAIKFNTFGQMITGFFTIFQNTEFNFRIKFTDLFLNYLNRYSDLFINNFLPTNVFIGGVLGLAVLLILVFKTFTGGKEGTNRNPYKFILFCLLCNLLIFMFGGQNATYTTVGMLIPAILGMLVLLQSIFKVNKIFGIILIVAMIISNLYITSKIAPLGQVALVIPKDMSLNNQLKLIDTTYQLAKGQPFSINSLTLPLWTNTTWAYLYHWYGQSKYGYLPKFYGRDQVGLVGSDVLVRTEKPLSKSFFIMEPGDGIPTRYYNQEISSENTRTKLESEVKYGSIILQVRKPL